MPANPNVHYRIGSDNDIDAIQVHSRAQASHFFAKWLGDVGSIRFERVRTSRYLRTWACDAFLVCQQEQFAFTMLAALVLDANTVVFPDIMGECNASRCEDLAVHLLDAVSRNPDMYELRVEASVAVDLLTVDLTHGRAVPGLCEYITAVNHIKRYQFAHSHLQPGPVIDCACGTGYGASILTSSEDARPYSGVDLDPVAVRLARRLNYSSTATFFTESLDRLVDVEAASNVVSLETMEHVQDPHSFMEHLLTKMAPDGQLILSMPAETWAGSHLNPEHLTNWNLRRFERLANTFFKDVRIHKQELSLLGRDTFGHSSIYDREGNVEIDETFVALLQRPRQRTRRPRTVIRRTGALGDVILATPVVEAIKDHFPERDLVVVTAQTEVFANNPFADIVAKSFRAARDDVVIDLDGTYERARGLHITTAYANAANIPVSRQKPAMFPSRQYYLRIADTLTGRWKGRDVARVLAIHAAATSPDRIWPATYWRELLAEILRDPSVGVILLGAESDFDLDALNLSAEPNVVSFVNQADLQSTAALVDLADILIAPDSGLSHVATAMRTPSIVLFGMADPATRLPLDGNARFVWSSVSCRGCISDIPPGAPPLCKLGKAICMDEILPETVMAEYRRALEGQPQYSWERKLRGFGYANLPRRTAQL